MKKLLAVALMLAIAIIPSLPALALAVNDGDDQGIGIIGNYTPVSTGPAISFDLEWDAMDFTYSGGTFSEWDESSHTYGDGYVPAGWIEEQKQIKITNHSDVGITASLTFVSAATGIKGIFDASTLNIESADADAYRTQGTDGKYPAPSAVSKFSIDPTSNPIDESKSLGKITVSVSVGVFNTVNGTLVITKNLQNAISELLSSGETVFKIVLADDDIAAFEAIYNAFAAADDLRATKGTVDLTIEGATEIPSSFMSEINILRAVAFPNATEVGADAFKLCNNLEEVSLPEVTKVGPNAFDACISLRTLTFGKPITYLGDKWMHGAFTENIALTISEAQCVISGNDATTVLMSSRPEDLREGLFAGLYFKELHLIQ